MFRVSVGAYVVSLSDGELPSLFDEYARHARLAEGFAMNAPEGRLAFVAVSRDGDNDGRPFLVVGQRYSPFEAGFHPGVLVAPETNVLFVAAGERVLAYDLMGPRRLWEDRADGGFWGWQRHGETVVMSAELELAAWTLAGGKLWTRFVEPPWSYVVRENRVNLDVMGEKSSFDLVRGPS